MVVEESWRIPLGKTGSDAVGGHYLLWGVVVVAVALLLLAVGLYAAWRERDV